MKATLTRRLALEALDRIQRKKAFPNQVLNEELPYDGLSQIDKNLVSELVYGVLRWRGYLDYALSRFSNRDPSSLDDKVIDILRLGAYQLIFLDKVPTFAAIDQSVELTKEHFHKGISSLVNAILRALDRGKGSLAPPPIELDPISHLAIKTSHPKWLVKMWLKELGPQITESILHYDNLRPKIKLRVNPLKINRDELLRRLSALGIEALPSVSFDEGIAIEKGINPTSLKDYDSGLFSIQDESSMLVSHVLSPKPREAILDACAGQGGKTTHIAELSRDQAEIVAIDTSRTRLSELKARLKRLGIKNVKIDNLDAAGLPASLGKFDKILVDAPCSSLGVLARRPDVKWKRKKDDIEMLAKVQRDLLASLSKVLKPGGRMVYSVCTISKKETLDVVAAFLKDHPNFRLEDLSKRDDLNGFAHDSTIQICPDEKGMDGMFIASLISLAN